MTQKQFNESHFIGKSELFFGDKAVHLPYRVFQVQRVKDRVVIRMADQTQEGRKLRALDPEERRQFISIINTGIWCFDLSGNLIWKIADAFPESAHRAEQKETGQRIYAGYVGFRYEEDTDTVVGFTAHGNETRVQLSDGGLVSRTLGKKM